MMRAVCIALALSLAVTGCGVKGKLKTPAQIEAIEKKKAKKAAPKTQEESAPSHEEK